MTAVGDELDQDGHDELGRLAIEILHRTVRPEQIRLPSDVGRNSGAFRSRRILAMVRPADVTEVRALVADLARLGDGRLHLHPVSSGRNWGFGSAEPVSDGAIVLDMSGLATIRLLDIETGVAVVEPGVSQGELAARLRDTDHFLNVTASSATTSVVGNTLDRGIGLHRQRTDDLIGLEVVLADGTVAHVGRWPRPDVATAPYAFQPGPNALHLFTQSNLGVVTAAAVRLLPRPRARRVVRLSFDAARLADAIDRLRTFQANGLTSGIIKIFSAGAQAAYGGEGGTGYYAYLHVRGTEALVAATVDELGKAVVEDGVFADSRVLDPEVDPGESVAERAALRGYLGDPDANDAMVSGIFGTPADQVDSAGADGWLFCVPVVPFTATAITSVSRLLNEQARQAAPHIVLGHTLNVLPDGWVDAVVSMRFARTPADETRAHELLDTLHERLAASGFHPYRLDIEHMRGAPGLRGDPGQEEILRRLKAVLDPSALISRGRYE
ncbi:FAD-binding oxidoreductase [Micromonospora sp. NPDC093244]|uniref:FAD-binding oxidoreductase n=1 Tax=Micromonospora sp. NPDC093244 TaxID=3155071 RepID=UPI003438CA3D